jgi:tetratricopeptide (TPR) repeat protein
VNKYFVGRIGELAELNQKLLVNQDCQSMSIIGLGGTGKTQVALQFAYSVKETQPEYSRALRIPYVAGREEDVKELVQQHLSTSRAGRWLLLVDNADDADIFFGTGQSRGIVDYLPESELGVVVYTTRTPEVAEQTRGDVIELGAMDRQDATAFLTRSLTRKDLLRNDATTTELLDELTCLPLAIAQAAAYLNKNGMSVAKYMQLLRSTEQNMVTLMSREFRDNTRYKGTANAVATTWVVSFSQIRERDAAAADLLAFMSYIEWKAIPRSLLPTAQGRMQMEEAIGTLCGYSFLARRSDSETEGEGEEEEWYDMHRLVHLATRIWVEKRGDATRVQGKAVRQVADIFPSDDHANLAVWRAYLPHALHLLEVGECTTKETSKLCLLVGQCLRVDGRIREAVRWLEESCLWREALDEDDSDRLLSQHVLAVAYEADGQVKKAVELLEAVVKARETLAADHPSRLASQHELAIAYGADGQVKKAVELLEAVVKARETLAADHPSRLASLHALAGAYEADGQVKKAVELLEAVVKARETLAADHPSRLASLHELAMAYEADGQVKKAVELLEAVVKAEEMLATDHPSRLASLHALAMAYKADGQVKKAVELLEAVVKAEETLAADHPSRLASLHALTYLRAELRRGSNKPSLSRAFSR